MGQAPTKRLITEQALADQFAANLTREALAIKDYNKLRPFFADIANWKRKRVDISFYGDSNPEGFSLTQWDDTSPAQLAIKLRNRYGMPAGARGFVGIQNDLANKPFWPIVYTGIPGANISATGYGTNMRQIALNGAGQKMVFSVATPLTSFYIHYAVFSTGTFYYKIDGGAAVNVVANGTAAIVPSRTLINAAVNATIEIGWISGAAYVAGIQENKGDENSGLQVHNLGWSGSYAKSWVDAAVANRSWPQCGGVLNSSLKVVNLGGNDGRIAGGNRTSAQFGADLTTFFAYIDAVMPAAPILMNMQWDLGASLLVEPWANYVAAAKTVCDANAHAVCVDHSARMYASNIADPLALYNPASPPHATPKGYGLYSQTMVSQLELR